MRKLFFLGAALAFAMLSFAPSHAAAAQQSKPVDQNASDSDKAKRSLNSVIGSSVPAPAALAALPADAPTRDQVMTLLDLLQVRKNMTVALDKMMQLMEQGAEQSFRQRVPNPTPKQLAALHSMFGPITESLSLDDMINAIIPIYQRHLTKADIDELVRFYSSPVGQKLLREQPEIMQESMQAGADVQQKRMNEITAKIQERMQKLIEAGDDPTPALKKE